MKRCFRCEKRSKWDFTKSQKTTRCDLPSPGIRRRGHPPAQEWEKVQMHVDILLGEKFCNLDEVAVFLEQFRCIQIQARHHTIWRIFGKIKILPNDTQKHLQKFDNISAQTSHSALLKAVSFFQNTLDQNKDVPFGP